MSITVVIGGQYGGEGKGKIVSYLSIRDNTDIVVRCGGPNSGHTVYKDDKVYKLRLLPAGFVNPGSRLLLAAGSIVNLDILRREIELSGIDNHRVGIDCNSAIITDNDTEYEKGLGLRKKIGSTLSGTGAGVVKRALRDGSIKLAKDVVEAEPFLTDVSAEINEGIDKDQQCIIEGTQGFGLSLYHTPHYPYVTSRDTTASAFLSEVGVSPLKVTSIVMAVRTFPIRVEGNSGPLKNEINWEELKQLSGYPHEIREFTTVTGKLRRVAKFDLDLVERAVMVNRPTEIALHGTDYIDFENKGRTKFTELTSRTKEFIHYLEKVVNIPINLIGTGPSNSEIIDKNVLSSTISSLPVLEINHGR